ncbi:MAG: hypothetical protein CL908_18000 [Deltaproteobacteria bacterium]|nr:hypothetical protein [Deltaproteobacteria bacterium]
MIEAVRRGLGTAFWLGIAAVLLAGTGCAAPAVASGEGADDGADAGTVVLLHGLGRSASNMLILEWRLEARGRRVCNIDYDTRVDRLEHAIDQVHESLLQCAAGARRIDFVTHSLGGLVLRGLLERYPEPRAGRAVMLAPPNAGSEIADRLRQFGFLEAMMGPIAVQLGTREQDLPQRLPAPPIPFGVIAGDRWLNPVGPLWLPAPHDGTVSVASTHLAGMSDHLVLPYTHTFIMNPGEVAHQIGVFLREGRFARAEEGRRR